MHPSSEKENQQTNKQTNKQTQHIGRANKGRDRGKRVKEKLKKMALACTDEQQ